LKNEVLTFTLGEKKISRITLGALEDMGYVVNYTAADPYGPSDIGTCAGCNDNRNLKGRSSHDDDAVKSSTSSSTSSSCYSGKIYDNVVRRGRQMLRDVHDYHMKQGLPSKHTSGEIVFTGHQSITVMYELEDGTLCSTVVKADHHAV
jgi:hypothetical protein